MSYLKKKYDDFSGMKKRGKEKKIIVFNSIYKLCETTNILHFLLNISFMYLKLSKECCESRFLIRNGKLSFVENWPQHILRFFFCILGNLIFCWGIFIVYVFLFFVAKKIMSIMLSLVNGIFQLPATPLWFH